MQADVADYYDSNTKKFLPSHGAMESGAIHRRLYAPGIGDSQSAAAYANELVLCEIQRKGAERVLDLGCGVGGTIRYLARRHEADYEGITISGAQVRAAAVHGTRIIQADFLDSNWFKGREAYDLIYAIESLQHNPDHSILAANLCKVTKAGSRLVVIDDFLQDDGQVAARLAARFRRYWHAPGFGAIGDLVEGLEAEGFSLTETEDLSSYIRSGFLLRFFGSTASFFIRLFGLRGRYMENIVGGNALVRMQRRGDSGYYKLVFTRISRA